MKPRALLIETHEWRGYARDRDLFDRRYVIGWVTVYRRSKSIAKEVRTLRADNRTMRTELMEWRQSAARAAERLGERLGLSA